MRALLAAALAVAVTGTTDVPAPAQSPAPGTRTAPRTEMRVYDLGLTDVAMAADVVRGLLSAEGRVYPDPAQHRLVVSDRPDVQARVAQALRTLSVAPRNVRIEVTAHMERTDRERRLEASGSVGAGPVRVGVGRQPPNRGVVIGGQESRSRTNINARQQLLVLSGGRASLTVAEQVPYSEWLFTWGVAHGLWAQTVVWQEVGTSMVVEPRVLGNGTILVRLTPRFDYRLAGGASQTVDVNELSTEVVVREGEEIALGGVPFRDESFRERFLVGIDESGQTASVAMTLRATVE
jgi:type II secretory pathway component GspD/PulD (secretin)